MEFDAVSTEGRVAQEIDGAEALADPVTEGSDALPAEVASFGGGEPWLGAVRAKVPITWHDVVVPAFVFLMARLAVLVTARAVTWARPETSVEQLLSSWDGGWYLLIAEDGYPDSLDPELSGGNRWAFYPAFPWLIRAFHELTGFSYTTSGIAVSIIVGTAAAIAIWSLVIEHFGRETALFTVALVCFFPTAYVLGMVYTESLFLLAAAVCLRAVGHRQWILAGLVASGAYLIRQHGAVLVGVVMVCGLWAVYRERRFRPLWAVVLVPTGAAAWSWYQWVETGTPVWSQPDVRHRRYRAAEFARLARSAGLECERSSHFFSFLWAPARVLRSSPTRTAEPGNSGPLGSSIVRLVVGLLSRLERWLMRHRAIPFGTSLWFELRPTDGLSPTRPRPGTGART